MLHSEKQTAGVSFHANPSRLVVALVAQLDRAARCYRVGRPFESGRGHYAEGFGLEPAPPSI